MARFGSPEYFKRLDQQVQAAIAPQLVAGSMNAAQAQEIRALAQYRAQKKVRQFYGQTSKYDGQGRLVRDTGQPILASSGRTALPYPIVTNPLDKAELVKIRQTKNKGRTGRAARLRAFMRKNGQGVSRKAFVPRTDGGYGDGPEKGR